MEQPALRRALSLPYLVLYGLGTTIGAGIYALVGELVAVSGYSALASFVVAALLVSLTAFSFAELSGRFPQAAGAAVYVREGFGSLRFSTLVGLLVIAAGLVSSAALINAMLEHLRVHFEIPRLLGVTVLALVLGAIAVWGIAESVAIAGLITLVGILGLLAVIWVSRDALTGGVQNWEPLLEGFAPTHWGAVYTGTLLAFYAFIGFEDMVVVAEEVKGVSLTLPLAILLTLLITTLLYLGVMAAALTSFSLEALAKSGAPLVDLYRLHQKESGWVINLVAMLSIINGALIQMIMASRVIYGLASRGQLPARWARVNALTRTPLPATLLVTAVVMVLAGVGRLAELAKLTSIIMLTVFAAANLALWRIKGRSAATDLRFCFPRWVPALGFLVSVGFLVSACFGG